MNDLYLMYNKRDDAVSALATNYNKLQEEFIIKALRHHGYIFTSADELIQNAGDFEMVCSNETRTLFYKNKPICCFANEPIISHSNDNLTISATLRARIV